MSRPKRTRAELINLFAEQRQALAASCDNYDKGNEWEAARLATAVYTLVHDGGSITSLLTQLGLRASLRFISSGRVPQSNLLTASPPLVMFQMQAGGTKFMPRLGRVIPGESRLVQYQAWWEKELIYRENAGGVELSRRRLVFALRHQDGGAHVGQLTDQAYVRLKVGGGWFGGVGSEPAKALINGVSATMRQVAWEITETLKNLGDVT